MAIRKEFSKDEGTGFVAMDTLVFDKKDKHYCLVGCAVFCLVSVVLFSYQADYRALIQPKVTKKKLCNERALTFFALE
jgi:ABC-type uncharacterized transport system permease subunit